MVQFLQALINGLLLGCFYGVMVLRFSVIWGIEIDREKIKPLISGLNMSVNILLASLVNLKYYVSRNNSKDEVIINRGIILGSKMDQVVLSMEALFRRMSRYDTALEKYKGIIYRNVGARRMAVEKIIVTVTLDSGKVDRSALSLELNEAIEISNALLASIQNLIEELGNIPVR